VLKYQTLGEIVIKNMALSRNASETQFVLCSGKLLALTIHRSWHDEQFFLSTRNAEKFVERFENSFFKNLDEENFILIHSRQVWTLIQL
jgi:hypothetical protein